ncbi:hypothetical protein J6A31_05170 [bacterium]|nr:hypothetical protein [bacterium]
MLRIPSFQKGNAINRQYKNVIKSKAIVTGMAITSFYVAANAAMSHNALPAAFFGVSTCFFVKRRKQFSYIAEQYLPDFVKILKRLAQFKKYQIDKLSSKGL